MADDMTFSFNPAPVMEGFKQIQQGMGNLQKTAQNAASGMGSSITKGVFKAQLAVKAFLGVAKGVVNDIKSNIPEIGEAFSMTREVFAKNFLWPIRQELMPLLQGLMDWVRDNRERFVAWGQAVANVFRVVIGWVKDVASAARGMADNMLGIFSFIFGEQVKSWEEAWNLLTFKVAVFAQFMGKVLEGLFGWLKDFTQKWGPPIVETMQSIAGHLADFAENMLTATESGNSLRSVIDDALNIIMKMVNWVYRMSDAFLEGFVPAVKNIMDPIGSIVSSFGDLVDYLFTGEDQLNAWESAFEFIGELVGTHLKDSLDIVADIIEWMVEKTGELIEKLEILGGDGGVLGDLKGFWMEAFGPGSMKTGGLSGAVWRAMPWVDDAIIKPDGQIVRTNPEDTIVATKSPIGEIANVGGGEETTVSVNMGSINLNVTEGSAQRAGEEFAMSFTDRFRSEMENAFRSRGR